jgi:hypothetical protein
MDCRATNPPTEPARKRRWYQFKLWHLLSLVTLVAVGLALVVRPSMLRRQRQRALHRQINASFVAGDEALEALTKLGVEMDSVEVIRFRRQVGHGSEVTEECSDAHTPTYEPIPISDADLAWLRWFDIREIDLGETAVTDEGFEHLAGLHALRSLYLHGTHMTSAGLVHLEGLTGLETLTLDRTRVADDGLEHLKGIRSLKKLYLTDTAVTDEGIRNLKKVLPELGVVR